MRKLIIGFVSLAFAAPAYAGCSTNDPSDDTNPKVVVCLMNKCETTVAITECSTGQNGWTTYGNGVTVTNDTKGIIAIHQGTHLVPRSQWKTFVIKKIP